MDTTRKFTPENITELNEDSIFVFGSNLNGNHAGGAAKIAVEKFGAIEGQAEGLQRQSYAIPTLDKDMKKVSLEDISASIDRLYQFADENADLDFYVTKLGCGIAGFEEKEIADLFKSKEFTPFNVILPMEFTLIRGIKGFDKNMQCRNMQFEENKEYHQNGYIQCCNNGIHFCENPFDVKKYYDIIGENVFCEVEGFGKIDTHAEDSKIAVSNIRIKEKINRLNVIRLGLNFILEKTTHIVKKSEDKGIKLLSRITKKVEKEIEEKGNSNTLAGQDSNTLAGRDYNTLAGRDYNTLAGRDSNTLAGQDGNIIACKFNNIIDLLGSNNIAVAANGSKIRGKIGNAICFVEFDEENNIEYMKSAIIDGKKVKENVFYTLKNNKIVKVK